MSISCRKEISNTGNLCVTLKLNMDSVSRRGYQCGNRTPSPMQFTPLQFAPCNLPYKTLPRYDFCHIRIVPQTTIALCDVCHLRFSPHTTFSLVLPMKTCAIHKFFVINRLRILNNPKSVDHKLLS